VSCLWRWRRQKREARAAAEEAMRTYGETQQRGREVDRAASTLARIRADNHFAERIERALRGAD